MRDDPPIFADTFRDLHRPAPGGKHRWRGPTPPPPLPVKETLAVTAPQPNPPFIRYPHAATQGYTARQVAVAYGLPVDRYDGSGTTIGIVELGGAYTSSDLTAAGLDPSKVTVIGVDGGSMQSDPQGADGEVELDVEVVAGVAPGARIRVYFAANTDSGFADATKQAAAECDAVSISWGSAESQWSKPAIKAFSAVLAAARAKGVPVFVAAGDAGSTDGTRSDVTDYPASDPSAIGCGGTRLTLDPSGKRTAEVVWNDNPTQSATGGGISKVFPGRQVPDLAGNADPVTGYRIVVDGQTGVIGGTSAVAPLLAACYAVTLQAFGRRYDLLNTVLTNPSVCFDVVQGNNGGYKAGPGRDAVSGYGVIAWDRLLAVLQSGTQIPAPGGGTPTSGGTSSSGSQTQALQQIESIAKAALGA